MMESVKRLLAILDHASTNGVTEVCVFQGGDVPTHVGYFGDYEAAASAIRANDGKGNIFVTLNPVKRDLLARGNNHLIEGSFKQKLKRTKDGETICESWFFLDVDADRPSGISSTEAELQAAIETGIAVRDWLIAAGVPASAILTAKSGNGAYVLVRLPDYEITPARTAIKAALLKYLANLFNTPSIKIDQSVKNDARLMCALGTMKVKGENIPERPHRRSSIGTVGGERFDPAKDQRCAPFDLYSLAEKILPKEEPTPKPTAKNISQAATFNGQGAFDIRDYLAGLGESKEARGFSYHTCPGCQGVGKLHVNQATGAYGCFHMDAGTCSTEAIRAALGQPKGLASNHANGSSAKTNPNANSPDGSSDPREKHVIRAVRMSDVKAEKVHWLWPGRIPLHSISIVEGIEGVGKSTLLCAIASAITTGKGLPDAEQEQPANVLWLAAEDDLSRVLKPRLEATDADCARVHAVGEPFTFDEQGIMALGELVAEHEPRLVIIDPIFAYTRGDANKGNDSRALTGKLKMIAEKFACAVVLVRHVGKSKGMGDPRAAGLYSIEWRAAARSVLLVGADPDQPNKRAITQTKNNLGPMAEALGYEISPDSESPSGARFYWKGVSDLTAERILATFAPEGAQGENSDAIDFLREALSEGEVEAALIERSRKAAGVSDYALRKAKSALGVKVRKSGSPTDGQPQKWVWRLPLEGVEGVEGVDEGVEGVDISENQRLRPNHSDKSSYGNNLAEGVENPGSQRLRGFSTPSAAREAGII